MHISILFTRCFVWRVLVGVTNTQQTCDSKADEIYSPDTAVASKPFASAIQNDARVHSNRSDTNENDSGANVRTTVSPDSASTPIASAGMEQQQNDIDSSVDVFANIIAQVLCEHPTAEMCG